MDEREVVARLRAAGCVFAEDEARLLIENAADVERAISRREAGEPLEQIVGWAEFDGVRVHVARGVFVPRRRTELLASEASRVLRAGDVVVELCCGSGAVSLILAQSVAITMHAVDLDPGAVACACENLQPVGARVYLGDLYDPLPEDLRGHVDVIVANAPYVPSDEIGFMPAEARLHEPTVALDGGADGLALHRRIAAEAPSWLAPGGHLLIETSERQADGTCAAMAAAGLVPVIVRDDDLDATIVVGGDQYPSRPAIG